MENTADYDTESFQYNTLLGPAGMQIVFITKMFAGPRVRVRLLFPMSADFRDPTCSDESFRRSLKTFLFAKY